MLPETVPPPQPAAQAAPGSTIDPVDVSPVVWPLRPVLGSLAGCQGTLESLYAFVASPHCEPRELAKVDALCRIVEAAARACAASPPAAVPKPKKPRRPAQPAGGPVIEPDPDEPWEERIARARREADGLGPRSL